MLFKLINPGGIFIVEELDFPDTRKDMNLNNEKPTLREVLNKIKLNDHTFESKYISNEEKKYFLKNFANIEIFKGNFNEIAIIQKK
jgi:hypothetical protein